jgi:DNA polymerase I-like protein with 3'-5' exonuclease and polymerase domains
MAYQGPKDPLVTIIMDSVGRGEDRNNELASDGSAAALARLISEAEHETGVGLDDIRWVPMTRCASWIQKIPNYKAKGGWCRYHVIDDLIRHTPKLIIPVGTTALGLLCHKSNAQEWTGRLLTYRGWPDEWLMDKDYALPRPDPSDETKTMVGHPVFGPVPTWKVPMVPIQAPRLIYALQNPVVYSRWLKSFIKALKLARSGVKAPNYIRDWYRFTDDLATVKAGLQEIIDANGVTVCFDTETTGLRQWATQWQSVAQDEITNKLVCVKTDARIVSMMFRWVDPATRQPKSIGFPWNFEESTIKAHMAELRPLIWQALTKSTVIGHNLTFDMLFAWTNLNSEFLTHDYTNPEVNRERDRRMCALANACKYDTWHMAFAWQQKKGSLGLEAMAYEWAPDLAGYEELFTLLIGLHQEMNPEMGGHYLNCPRDKWDTHLKPYVMGDVEVAYQAYEKISDKLKEANVYEIPLADPARPARFRWFTPPSRDWVYRNIMSPASIVLMKLMARGLYVDQQELAELAVKLPKTIDEERRALAKSDERIAAWISQKKAEDKEWELDLENKTQLKELLFDRLRLPVLRLTKQGKKLYGENIDDARNLVEMATKRSHPGLEGEALENQIAVNMHEFAAVDKFTLNKLTVQLEHLRPLRTYRKLFKVYSTYIRPLQNIMTAGLDKKKRKGDPHLCFDGCIHAQFLLAVARSGRLASRDPNMQNLPRKSDVKSIFVSRFGARGCMYTADLSQIELRLLASASGDPTMVKAYFDGTDLHSLTASKIFKLPYEHFTKDYMKWLQDNGKDKEAKDIDEKRTISKTSNFLTGYGGGAFGLQNVLANNDIDKSIEECQFIIESFFDSYPSIRAFIQYYKRFILEYHVAVSIFGRVRVFEEVRGDDEEAKAKALRSGCNHIIQSTASDMMLVALFVIEHLMREAGLESLLVSTVHDSLMIDAIRDELPQIHEIVMSVLNNFPETFKLVFGEDYDTSWMITPFAGDAEVGLSYGSQKKLPEDATKIDWEKILHDEKE